MDASGNLSMFRVKGVGGFAEHYPFTDGLIYAQPFAGGRWISGISPLVTMAKPHVFVATHRSGQQVAYQNGRVLASDSRVETPGLDAGAGFGGNGTAYLVALWARVLSPSEVVDLSSNPWQLFESRRIFVPVAAPPPGIPTLSAATVFNITATTARPRVTVTF